MSSNGVEQSIKEGVILGIGNPLLDISANVEHDVLKKYLV